ncbi:hypothetical protein SAMN05421820_101785 [Pedobacter steynii]|uniref:Uncharacterized protein n=1 Tax=Pedobacter steynii TaxID=430522 RepID=A0A1G9L5X6_9SPHI|nr:hypothetical protein [Pedobacter steynii]NQX38752.1 hypothetical protein [Pedobacter steynii]SDL57388.1 hypothetical protein SAMN05421820_101785 [Pedobacter steynii]
MFKYHIIPSFLLFALISCNPVGADIAEIPLKRGEVSSAEGIDLKKGDKVTIWSKLETNDKDDSPAFKVKYHIESAGKSLLYDSLDVFNGNHQINSKKTTESYRSSSDDKESTIYYTQHEFEIENTQFIVPKDGKYNFDFKLTQDLSTFSKGFSIILRK